MMAKERGETFMSKKKEYAIRIISLILGIIIALLILKYV